MTSPKAEDCGIYRTVGHLYTKLVEAKQKADTLTLQAKFFTTEVQVDLLLNYTITIYQDVEHKKLLGEEQIPQSQLSEWSQEPYYKKGASIYYTFQKDANGSYYFDHSEVK